VIPPSAGVASTQNLLAHLATRPNLYQIPILYTNGPSVDPIRVNIEYLAIDMATDTNDARYRSVVQSALGTGYGVACTKRMTVILEKGASSQTLSPELQRWLAGDCSARACLLGNQA